jgi:hypothetical protein
MKSNLDKTSILFIAVIIINLFLVGSCFLLWQKIITTTAQINTLGQEVINQEVQKNSSYRLTTVVEKEIDPAKEQIDKYFIKGDNYIDFVEYIESLADKAQVSVDIKGTELKGALQLSIDLEGTFSNSMYFSALVESLPVNLKIENMRIEQKGENDSWQGWITIVMLGSGEGGD